MALDEALMRRARETSTWLVRVYSWSSPTLSFGRNQRARGGYDLNLLDQRGIDVVRRPTGGRAILHDHELTYAVAGPVEDAGDLRESYVRINRLLVAGLRALGVGAVAVSPEEALAAYATRVAEFEQPGLLPCFHHPSVGEITLDGRKLVGSAQWRGDGALLQHGSILIDDDQMQLASLLIEKGASIPPPATLREALGCAPTDVDLSHALLAAIRAEEDSDAEMIEVDAPLLERANALQAHYLDDGWTWRR